MSMLAFQVPVHANTNGDPVAVDSDPAVLRQITSSSTSMAIWERSHDSGVAALGLQLRGLPADQTPNGRFVSKVTEIEAGLEKCYQQPASSDEHAQIRQAVAQDVTHLAEMFQGITKANYVEIRMQLLRSDACRFWHQDSVDYRLLCTYYGPGTQWVSPEHSAEVLAARDSWDGPCHNMKAGDVSLFAGACASGKSGIVHRSPPIKAMGKTRLMLCINTRNSA
ncbi:MAG: DUF1826 domain-containing protein [Pseudomonadota bacterium]